STSLPWFLFFRCATFVGVCIEFVAAITWLAELFPDKGAREKVLGWTQAFASVGGIMVTGVNAWTLAHAADLPAIPVPEPFNAHANWRYTLISGLLPALPIALMLPFVPESPSWRERRRNGTLTRPSFGALFSPELRRTTLVTAALSACAYGVAFGALQLTPTRIVPGLADLAEQRKVLKPLQDEAKGLNAGLDAVMPAYRGAVEATPGLAEVAGQRARLRVAMRTTRRLAESADAAARPALVAKLSGMTNELARLDGELAKVTEGKPDARKAVVEREKAMGQIAANREKQEGADTVIKSRGNAVQLRQELGGLAGRIALALLVVAAVSRGTLLRLFQVPGVIVLPVTYYFLFQNHPEWFGWGVAVAGFLTVAQFSYFGEYLPKVFPLHLRGTGGSFATNVGGRMFGTSAAYLTSNILAPMFTGTTFEQVAKAAAVTGCAAMVLGVCLSFLLPEPKGGGMEGH
ncbi:MAG: MFS transporter, partial [Verrucomicrobiota bacterium]